MSLDSQCLIFTQLNAVRANRSLRGPRPCAFVESLGRILVRREGPARDTAADVLISLDTRQSVE